MAQARRLQIDDPAGGRHLVQKFACTVHHNKINFKTACQELLGKNDSHALNTTTAKIR